MKRTFRILATFLSIALIICTLPQSVLAQIGDLLSTPDTEATETVSPDIYVLCEVIDNRTETSKTFRMSDGSFIAADYGQVIHYAGEDGAWTDYDNTLTFSEASARDVDDMAGYGNTGSNLRIKLANNSNSNNLVKLTMGNYKISLHLVGADKSKALEVYPAMEDPTGNDIDSAATLHKFSAGAIYEDILPDVDLEYIISGGSVKENIIIKDTADSYTYTFELKLHGLVPEVDSDGNILLKDETTNITQLVIPAGYMFDANGAYSDAVTYSIAHQNGQKYTLTVTADADWINANDRAFPVTVDPTVEAVKKTSYPAYAVIKESTTGIIPKDPIGAGYFSDPPLQQHLLVKQSTLPAIPDSATIVEAKLTVHHTELYRTSVTIAAKQITTNWAPVSATWQNKPNYNNEVLDYATLTQYTQGTEVKFDITRLVQAWYQGTCSNFGVVLCPLGSEDLGLAYFSIATGQQPNFLIQYRDTKGLESIWTYASHNAGVAGTGYVNGFNGNLVFTHSDIATEGSVIPVAVSHVYNSFLAGKQYTKNTSDINAPFTSQNGYTVGKGWKLSIQETLLPRTFANSDKAWYVYADADGTELYFYQSEDDNSKYISEDGYGLIVNVETTGVASLTDEYGNEKRFNPSGRLTLIIDAYGNKKQILYTDNNQPSQVRYFPVDEAAVVSQLRFTYNAAGALKQITNQYNTSDYVTFHYSETYNGLFDPDKAGYLRVIQYSLGGYTLFNYNEDGTLKSVENGDTNYTISYAYANKRVQSVTETAVTSTGQTVSFAYDSNRFMVRTAGQDDIHNNNDDILTTVMYDNFGKGICSYSSNLDGSTVYGTSYTAYTETTLGSKANNKVTTDAVKGITEENILKDGNCETVSWTGSTSGTGYASASSNAKSMFGRYSYKFSSTAGGTGYAARSQTVAIPSAGTYTLSAYVKTENVTTSSGGGAYLVLSGTGSERLTGTTNESIQNGWRRISVTKTFASAGNHTVQLRLANATGIAYFDCVQLERSDTPSDYNFIINGSLQNSAEWGGLFEIDTTDESRDHVGMITGTITSARRATQTIAVNAPVNTTFMLSGWAKASSADLFSLDKQMTDEEFEEYRQQYPTEAAKRYRCFGMTALITYSDSITESHYVSFNPEITDWQYTSLVIVPRRTDPSLTIHSIMVLIVYDFNVNTMYFDDICLTVEPAQTYHYDANGNLTASTDTSGNNSLMEYAANGVDPAKYTTVTGDVYNYEYTETHDLSKVTRTVHTVYDITQTLTYGYDKYGNATSSELFTTESAEKITSSAEYTEYGNYLGTTTDSLGGVTEYSYDSVTKLLAFIEDANNNRTAYQYDTRQRTTHVYLDADKDSVIDTTEASVEYLYAQNRLSGITTAKTAYTLTYDVFGNLLSIKAGESTLATYEYAERNGKLTKLTYGNGDYEQYTYDHLDRLVKVVYNGNASSGYELFYDANGRLYKTVDHQAGLTHFYDYDSLNRLIFARQKNASGSIVLEVHNAYDELGRTKGSTYVIGNTTQTYDITYENVTGLLASYTTPQNHFRYFYDSFDRPTIKTGDKHAIEYTYVANSQRVASYSISQADSSYVTYSYTYDAAGNITSIKKNGTTVSVYEYDFLGRLIRENDCVNSTAWVYTYDNAGNLLKKYTFYGLSDSVPASHLLSIHPYNGSEISSTYTYSDTPWGDLLTNYNGIAISYTDAEDASGNTIGNPLNWRNATNMEWHQRSLKSMSIGGTNVSYTYNADGIRTQKTVGAGGHMYVLDGNTILKETIYTAGTLVNTLYYYYDESGVSGLEYNGTKYSYVKNLQGDVIGIINANGVTVVEYKYDAWGNILSTTGSMASTLGATNPFRYRGYYYDIESGWYYLNNRYYDPEVGRWISADSIVAGVGENINGYNLFAYCFNNPINMDDQSGNWPEWLENTVKIVSVVLAVTAVVATVSAVSAFTAGTGSAAAVYGANIFLGATLSGINGGIANEAKGNSYINGYLGGSVGGAIQSVCSKTGLGTMVGGGAGVAAGTVVTDVLNNLDPDSTDSSANDIVSNALTSGGKALVTSSFTAYTGYASNLARLNGANGLMPTYTYGFGESVKAFFGWLDDALVYIWE